MRVGDSKTVPRGNRKPDPAGVSHPQPLVEIRPQAGSCLHAEDCLEEGRSKSSQMKAELFSGMKRSPSPLPSPPGRGRVLPAVGKCSLLGGTACRGPCDQGRQHAVPPPGRGRNEFPLLPSPLRFDAIPASHRAVAQRRRVGERERVRAVHVLNCMDWAELQTCGDAVGGSVKLEARAAAH